MSPSFCQLAIAVSKLLQIYIVVLLLYALASWLPGIRGRWSDIVVRLVEPVLLPLRQVIPPIAGIDLSFLLLFLFLQWLVSAIVPSTCFYTAV